MNNITIKKVPILFRLIDVMMMPLMFALGGLKTDSIQETHPWHIQKLQIDQINPSMMCRINSSLEKSNFNNNSRGPLRWLFHAPIFGGWKKYTALEANVKNDQIFYLGWVVYYQDDPKPKVILNTLPVAGKMIRCLNGNKRNKAFAFAIDESGTQVQIKIIDTGTLGDMKYKNIRLF